MRPLLAAAVDAVVVLAFAAVGRASHQEASPVLGTLGTAWPFLVGTAVGWGVVRVLSRRWPTDVGSGITVAALTVVVGMVLRAVTGQGTAPSFVLVATLVLAVLLVGWRAGAARVR